MAVKAPVNIISGRKWKFDRLGKKTGRREMINPTARQVPRQASEPSRVFLPMWVLPTLLPTKEAAGSPRARNRSAAMAIGLGKKNTQTTEARSR